MRYKVWEEERPQDYQIIEIHGDDERISQGYVFPDGYELRPGQNGATCSKCVYWDNWDCAYHSASVLPHGNCRAYRS